MLSASLWRGSTSSPRQGSPYHLMGLGLLGGWSWRQGQLRTCELQDSSSRTLLLPREGSGRGCFPLEPREAGSRQTTAGSRQAFLRRGQGSGRDEQSRLTGLWEQSGKVVPWQLLMVPPVCSVHGLARDAAPSCNSSAQEKGSGLCSFLPMGHCVSGGREPLGACLGVLCRSLDMRPDELRRLLLCWAQIVAWPC